MTRPVCLVTGATGALGPGIVATLRAGYDIRTLSRRPPRPGLFASDVTALTGDVSDLEQVRRAARGSDVIVHLAALLHINDPSPDRRCDYERVNVGGTAAVLEAARSESVPRVVLMSTIAVYGHAGGRVLDETSAPRPHTLYAETKLAAERLALAAERPDGRSLATVLRLGAVYGARMKGNYERLVHALAKGWFVPVGRGQNRRTLVFDEDVAAAVSVAAVHPNAPGRIYNVTDGGFHSMRNIIDAISAALGRRAPRWHVPVPPVRGVLALGGLIDRRLPRRLDTYLEDIAVRGDRIGQDLGFRPRVNLADGWGRTIADMRRAGLL